MAPILFVRSTPCGCSSSATGKGRSGFLKELKEKKKKKKNQIEVNPLGSLYGTN
jgi:hypothetical protein